MKAVKKFWVIGIFLMANFGYAEDFIAMQSTVGLKVKCTEDLTLGVRGAFHIGKQLEQMDAIKDLNYKKDGLTAQEYAGGFEVPVGELGNMTVSAGGELVFRLRKLDDSTVSKDYLEYSPTGLVNLTLPFLGGCKAQLFNRLARRNLRSPTDQVSQFQYTAQTRLSTPELTSFKILGYLYYQGYVQKNSAQMAGWGTGIRMIPAGGLTVEGAFTTLWSPLNVAVVVHQAELNISYLLDFTK